MAPPFLAVPPSDAHVNFSCRAALGALLSAFLLETTTCCCIYHLASNYLSCASFHGDKFYVYVVRYK